MYHAHFRGTHYEAGFRWGSLLLKHKNIILEHIPFEITRERAEYAAACVPVYERHYPEILEEIRGLAEGQRCDVRILQAVLFSMYAMPPVCNCSCFAAATENEVFLGRNSDFLTELEKLNQNVVYRLTDGAYSFTGNTTAFVEMEDGVNEHGLAIGLTSVYPLGRKPGLNAGMLLRYVLEKCRTVAEAVSRIDRLPIASAQTLTLADRAGDMAVIECDSEGTAVAGCQPAAGAGKKFVCATNAFHLLDMARYGQLSGSPTGNQVGNPDENQVGSPAGNQVGNPDENQVGSPAGNQVGNPDENQVGSPAGNQVGNPDENQARNSDGNPDGRGFGSPEAERDGRPGADDWFAEERYRTLFAALNREETVYDIPFAKGLLSGRHGFLCQYDRTTGKDTVWSVVYDVKRGRIYRSEGNPGRCRYKEDTRFQF